MSMTVAKQKGFFLQFCTAYSHCSNFMSLQDTLYPADVWTVISLMTEHMNSYYLMRTEIGF